MRPETVATKLQTTPKTVRSTVKKYEETGSVSDRPRSGRKRIFSESDEKKIVKKARKKKKAPLIAKEMGDRSSARTIQRILREKGLFSGKVKKIEKLTARHKERRVECAKNEKGEV